jgi:hypothetical protein
MYVGGGQRALVCGTMFKLKRPGAGQAAWMKTTVYGGSDGGTPQGKLLLGIRGVLYGAAYKGGTEQCKDLLYQTVIGCGVIFKGTSRAARCRASFRDTAAARMDAGTHRFTTLSTVLCVMG